jgi:hypothetical protein
MDELKMDELKMDELKMAELKELKKRELTWRKKYVELQYSYNELVEKFKFQTDAFKQVNANNAVLSEKIEKEYFSLTQTLAIIKGLTNESQ